tara:strand:- start:692 stop:1108 length:417 start_codon:yes stop_codon:yes gene_type:complete
MAYTGTLVAGGPGNFKSPNSATEHDGVEVDFITVDYISAMNAEVTFPLASANTAGLQLAMEAIQNQGVNILGKGVLSNSNTEQTYMVRRDSLDTVSGTTTAAAIQAAIRALNSNSKITATISSATAADRDMGDTSVGG